MKSSEKPWSVVYHVIAPLTVLLSTPCPPKKLLALKLALKEWCPGQQELPIHFHRPQEHKSAKLLHIFPSIVGPVLHQFIDLLQTWLQEHKGWYMFSQVCKDGFHMDGYDLYFYCWKWIKHAEVYEKKTNNVKNQENNYPET